MKIALEISESHARVVQDACELLMRMKLGQSTFPTEIMLGWPGHEEMSTKEYCRRRDIANPIMEAYLKTVLGRNAYGLPDGKKDEVECMAYEVWGTIRHAIWQHEHPNGSESWSVLSQPPLHESDGPMPKCEVIP